MSATIIRSEYDSTLYVIFGSGLIGGEVIRVTSTITGSPQGTTTRFNWADASQVQHVITQLLSYADQEKIEQIEVFWCAGRAGFYASQKEMSQEQVSYLAAITQFEKMRPTSVCFNLLSSAGGLFEGVSSGVVGSKTPPRPIRSYGKYKLEQERILQSSGLLYRIYRPTTVYGHARTGVRRGLVSTLISNTFNQVTTTIHASPNTLRDYVYVGDVAKLMILNAVSRSETGQVSIVSSGRPISIYYLLEKVRLALSKRPRVNYISSLGNEENMFFKKTISPNLLSLTSLEEGIGLLARQYWFHREY